LHRELVTITALLSSSRLNSTVTRQKRDPHQPVEYLSSTEPIGVGSEVASRDLATGEGASGKHCMLIMLGIHLLGKNADKSLSMQLNVDVA
jgi:hypothetical protein